MLLLELCVGFAKLSLSSSGTDEPRVSGDPPPGFAAYDAEQAFS